MLCRCLWPAERTCVFPRPRQRRTCLGLHRVQLRRDSTHAEASGNAGGEGSPTDLHEQSVERRASDAFLHVSRHFPADGAAAIEAPRVLGALHAERNRSADDRLTKAMHTWVSRRVGRTARTLDHHCAQ